MSLLRLNTLLAAGKQDRATYPALGLVGRSPTCLWSEISLSAPHTTRRSTCTVFTSELNNEIWDQVYELKRSWCLEVLCWLVQEGEWAFHRTSYACYLAGVLLARHSLLANVHDSSSALSVTAHNLVLHVICIYRSADLTIRLACSKSLRTSKISRFPPTVACSL